MATLLLKNQGIKFLHLEKNGEVVSGISSGGRRTVWQKGAWQSVAPPRQECVGLNCSRKADQAYRYVPGNVMAIVEHSGVTIEGTDKITCQSMRIVELYRVPIGLSCGGKSHDFIMDKVLRPENIVGAQSSQPRYQLHSGTAVFEPAMVNMIAFDPQLVGNVPALEELDYDELQELAEGVHLGYGAYLDEFYLDDACSIGFKSRVTPDVAAVTVKDFIGKLTLRIRDHVNNNPSSSSNAYKG